MIKEKDNLTNEALMEELYDELRKIARSYLRRERPGHTLQTSALVHEAYLRLAKNNGSVAWDKPEVYSLAARCMRRVLVDHARGRKSIKRDAGVRVEMPTETLACLGLEQDWVLVDQALNKLAAMDERQAAIVEMRIFAGLSTLEIAQTLGISESAVKRSWVAAKAWLSGELI